MAAASGFRHSTALASPEPLSKGGRHGGNGRVVVLDSPLCGGCSSLAGLVPRRLLPEVVLLLVSE